MLLLSNSTCHPGMFAAKQTGSSLPQTLCSREDLPWGCPQGLSIEMEAERKTKFISPLGLGKCNGMEFWRHFQILEDKMIPSKYTTPLRQRRKNSILALSLFKSFLSCIGVELISNVMFQVNDSFSNGSFRSTAKGLNHVSIILPQSPLPSRLPHALSRIPRAT